MAQASFGPDPMTPRNVLAAIPGVQVVEMKRNQRWAWCYGGGSGVPEADPNLARWSNRSSASVEGNRPRTSLDLQRVVPTVVQRT